MNSPERSERTDDVTRATNKLLTEAGSLLVSLIAPGKKVPRRYCSMCARFKVVLSPSRYAILSSVFPHWLKLSDRMTYPA
jgi:hypothetical protein